MALMRSLQPRFLVHGHPPLTVIFTVEALPAIEAALHEPTNGSARPSASGGRSWKSFATTSSLLHCAITCGASYPYLGIRDNLVKRIYHQSGMDNRLRHHS